MVKPADHVRKEQIMRTLKIKYYLEVITTVAVLLMAMTLLSALSWGYFVQKRVPPLQSGLQKGEVVSKLPKVDYSNSSQTILIVMDMQCRFCLESIPFYNHLAQLPATARGATRLIAIFPNEEDEVKEYVRQNQLQIDTVSGIDTGTPNIVGTPSIILVDRSGKILDFWTGKLSAETESQVIKAITASKA